jgi:hypothetical protein
MPAKLLNSLTNFTPRRNQVTGHGQLLTTAGTAMPVYYPFVQYAVNGDFSPCFLLDIHSPRDLPDSAAGSLGLPVAKKYTPIKAPTIAKSSTKSISAIR